MIPRPAEVVALHRRHISPRFVRLLGLWGYGRVYSRAAGSRVYDSAGRAYLDFLSAFGAMPLGHAPGAVHAAIRRVLTTAVPALVHTGPPPLAGRLAAKLLAVAPSGLERVAFASGGAEAVELAITAACRATGRTALVGCHGAFHGVSAAAFAVGDHGPSRMSGIPVPGARRVPFGDAAALDRALRRRDVAAFVVEPIQGEGGIHVPPPEYLPEASRLCRRYGTLLVVDEIQTGLGRTGAWFASGGIRPDLLLVGKALGAGIVPVSAALMTGAVHRRAYPSLADHELHTSTYAGATLGMAVGVAVVDEIARRGLVDRARSLGDGIAARLAALAARSPAVRAVRGRGLLWGVELASARPVIGQWVALKLLERGVHIQPAGHAGRVLRLEPPLTISGGDLATGLDAVEAVIAELPGPVRLAGAMAARVARQGVRGFPAIPAAGAA